MSVDPSSSATWVGFADPRYRTLLDVRPSLTRALTRWMGEPMALLVLAQDQDPRQPPPSLLRLGPGEPWMRREVLLCGRHSRWVYAHARSHIAQARLPGAFRRRLEARRVPMGRFWNLLVDRISREKLDVSGGRVGNLGRYFGLCPAQSAVTRRYRVRLRGRPVMVITETIPWGSNGPLAPGAPRYSAGRAGASEGLALPRTGGSALNGWSRSKPWP